MREEILWWLKQAEADFRSAGNSFASKDYHTSVFSIHQAVEKALKAVYIQKEGTTALKTHNLIELGKHLKVPPLMLNFLAKISPEYALSRYPDASYGIPAERYTSQMVEEYIKEAEKVLSWAQSQIRK
ncbi:HEPN domain-containing protein [Candidatus Micrarchaeota archaeon]|nr:HEPN domain-containing protein [Candidatus Micrarchaeota archaeon]